MSKNVSLISCGKYKYIRVCESYRNDQGKPRSKVIENHGRLDIALAKDPQYVDKLRARVKQENEAAKAAQINQIENTAKTRINKLEKIANGAADYAAVAPICLGAAVVRQVWKDLALPQLFRYLQSKTKIEYSYDKSVFLLASQRIINPGSKLRTFNNKESSIISFDDIKDLNIVYRVLDRLSDDKHNIVRYLNKAINKKTDRKITAAFYDVTTYAFESRTVDNLKNFGLSKDHKVNEVQVVLGLVIDDQGIPLDYELFPGNTSEFGTMLPIIERLKKTYKLDKLIVVADRGLNSDENLQGLTKLGCDFVIAQKIKNCTREEKDSIQDNTNWDKTIYENGNLVIQYKTMDKDKSIYTTKISPNTQRKYRVGKPIDTIATRWIISYSQKRAKKDLADIDRAVDKAQKALLSGSKVLSLRGFKSYIKMPAEKGQPSLNLVKVQEDKKWAGYYAICTNLKTETPEEITKIYRGLWRIEDCFRISKTTLEARPCFVWTEKHIQGHFMSCYLSLVLEKYIEYMVKQKEPTFTTEKICTALRTAMMVYDDDPQFPQYLRAYTTDTGFDQLLRIFGLTPPLRLENKKSLAKKLKLKDIANVCTTPV